MADWQLRRVRSFESWGETRLHCGKYCGKSFGEVLLKDLSHCDWVLKLKKFYDPSLARFNRFLQFARAKQPDMSVLRIAVARTQEEQIRERLLEERDSYHADSFCVDDGDEEERARRRKRADA